MSESSSATQDPKITSTRSRRWPILFALLWMVLAARIGLAIVRGESLGDDLALPTIALVIQTALLGSFLYARLQTRSSDA